MQILILSGSRNRRGQTARAIKAIQKGIAEGKGKSEVIFLPELKLERCRQCDPSGDGPCTREGYCIIQDDFADIMEKMKAADLIIFANPVYFNDLTESMKSLLDRYRRVRFHWVISGSGAGVPSGEQETPVAIYCYAGGMSGNGAVSCAANMNGILQMCGFDVVDIFLARRQNLEMKIPMLELTGKWLTTKPTSGSPLIPPRR
jgi:NAD(P)H-dependent FMN reductase